MLERLKSSNIIQIILEIISAIILIIIALIFMNAKTYLYDQHRELSLLYKRINKSDEELIFVGNPKDNYLKYNNLLWRIVRVNKDGTMVLILDKSINLLPRQYGKDFDIIKYLNGDFLKELDKSKLVRNNLCYDEISDINNVTCKNKSNEYVSLLDVTSYIQSIDDISYISSENDLIWLLNSHSDNEHFHTNGSKVSYSNNSNFYSIKPVVTLNNDLLYESGNGTEKEPYEIKCDKLTIGSNVIIENDEYTVISTKDNIKLLANNYIEDIRYNDAIDYLNIDYYDNLSYNKYLIDNKCDETTFEGDSINEEVSNKKICIPSIYDLKLSNIKDGYLLSKIDNYNLIYDDKIIYGTKEVTHNIYPVITISKNSKLKYNNNNNYIFEK